MYLLYVFEFLNLVVAFFSIAVGIKSLKNLTENRILIFIPILSLLETILSEFLGMNNPKNEASITTIYLINIYIYVEYLLICIYFLKLTQGRKHKAFILTSIPITITSIYISNYNLQEKSPFKLDIFLLIEGPIILTIALLLTIELKQ